MLSRLTRYRVGINPLVEGSPLSTPVLTTVELFSEATLVHCPKSNYDLQTAASGSPKKE